MDFFTIDQFERRYQRLASEEDVRRDIKVFEHVELLVNEADAEIHRIVDIVNFDGLAIDKQLTFFRLIDATEDFHQRGFTSSVLAAEGEDLALADS